MTSRLFTTREVSRITALSLRQLQWWAEHGVLVPTQHKHSRQYTEADLFAAMLYRELRARHVPLSDVRRVQRQVRAQKLPLPHPLYRWLLTNGTRTALLIGAADVLAFQCERRTPAYHVISLAALESRMRDGIAALDAPCRVMPQRETWSANLHTRAIA